MGGEALDSIFDFMKSPGGRPRFAEAGSVRLAESEPSEPAPDSCRPKQKGRSVATPAPASAVRSLFLDFDLVVHALDVFDRAGQLPRPSTSLPSCRRSPRAAPRLSLVSMLIWCALVRGSPASADFTLAVISPSSATSSAACARRFDRQIVVNRRHILLLAWQLPWRDPCSPGCRQSRSAERCP